MINYFAYAALFKKRVIIPTTLRLFLVDTAVYGNLRFWIKYWYVIFLKAAEKL